MTVIFLGFPDSSHPISGIILFIYISLIAVGWGDPFISLSYILCGKHSLILPLGGVRGSLAIIAWVFVSRIGIYNPSCFGPYIRLKSNLTFITLFITKENWHMHSYNHRSTKSRVFYSKHTNYHQYTNWISNTGVALWGSIDNFVKNLSIKTFSSHFRNDIPKSY